MQFFKDLAYKSIEEVGEANEKRKRAEADTDAERLKRRLLSLKTLQQLRPIPDFPINNPTIVLQIENLLEIEEEFLGDAYKEDTLTKSYETMYSDNTIGEKIEEVNEQLKEVQTKYPKQS